MRICWAAALSLRVSVLLAGCLSGFAHKTCYVYHTTNNGFGSNVYGLLLAVAFYGYKKQFANNTVFYLDESGWSYKCRGAPSWTNFFAGRHPHFLPSPNHADTLRDCASTAHIGYLDAHNHLKHVDVDEVFALLGMALADVWKLSDRVQELAQKQAAFLSTLRRPVLGVHVRAGDKHKEDLRANRDPRWFEQPSWLAHLDAHLHTYNFTTPASCVIVGDDLRANSAAAIAAAKNLSCSTVQLGGQVGGHTQAAFDYAAAASRESQDRDLGCLGTQSVVLHLETLAHADYFTGTYYSNIARIVHLLRVFKYNKPTFTASDISGLAWHHDWEFHMPA